MLDGLLGRGFSSKCKSFIKATRSRIEVVRRRAEAKQRFLKDDLAKLLANGLDINAYGRTEEFLAGLCLLSCYDFIENCCEYILKQLSIMQKQRECPEECRQAVSSLMFAAARFSDLPELRDLRDAFQERYGSSFECFVNQVFAEKLASRPPKMEKRLQLLQDIALEFSIKWDSKAFEQRMASSSAQEQPKKYEPSHTAGIYISKLPNGKETLAKTDMHDVTSRERCGVFNNGHSMRSGKEGNILIKDELGIQSFGRQESTGNGHKPLASRGQSIVKGDNNDISFRGRREFAAEKHISSSEKEDSAVITIRSSNSARGQMTEYTDGGYTMHSDRLKSVPKGERRDLISRANSEVAARSPISTDGLGRSQQNNVSSPRRAQEGETEKSYYNSALPPPYVKSKDGVIPPPYIKEKGSSRGTSRGSKLDTSDNDGSSSTRQLRSGGNAVVCSDRVSKQPDNPPYAAQDRRYQNDIPLPKPKSRRRKQPRSSSSHDDAGNFDEARIVNRTSSSRKKEHSRKGLQILFDDEHHEKDEDERMMDKLLLHYSKKTSNYDITKLRKKSQAHPSHGGSPHDRSIMVPHPTRSVSLPHEQPAPAEAAKVFTRANSYQPDNQAPHVHPKLPDYDDLAARFAALRGR